MLKEEDCKPHGRYLFAQDYFSVKSLAIWQNECIIRCKDKEKGDAYTKYINWKPAKNEIAVFTLYAYADFPIPKKMDTIFRLDDPSHVAHTEFELTQSIYEAWYPMEEINHGHKHLCVFSFSETVPEIVYSLHSLSGKFSTLSKEHPLLGFCHSADFEAIKIRIDKVKKLEKQHGEKWWVYDDGE
ncbi:MAG: hypothetical protein NTW29_11920 [Bacteroidetes bacterium]|nr:hypothetical protein [Bacteroidota bacterium]